MKLTRHNGRSGKNGAYNPKHNDRRFDIRKSDHIDSERAMGNVYWDYYQGYHYPETRDQEDQIVFSFEEVEAAFYAGHYDDYCEAQHERNRKTGHSNRDRSTEDLRKDKKTCPEESLIQIGTIEQSVSPETLLQIAEEFFAEFDRRFGEHVHILDWSLHLDEATPHIHERHVFDCENRYGEIAPQQEKALEALGFDLPDPEKKSSPVNNRKVTFDTACRAMLFDITKKHGLHLDQEPEYGGRKYLEKQDYILMKQKERMEEQEQEIQKQEDKLETITIRLEDTEAFVEEVADAAYTKAVETVTRTVQEKVRKEDLRILSEQKKIVLADPKLTDSGRKFAGMIFSGIIERFKGVTMDISNKLDHLFRNPAKKEEIKSPIRQSIREQLANSWKEADACNAYRRREMRIPKNRQLEIRR